MTKMRDGAQSIGWIGLGNMGSAMCKNLILQAEPTYPVIIYDIVPERAENLIGQFGHQVLRADTAVAAARTTNTIFLMLPNDDVVKAVLKEITSDDIGGKIIVDCSTVHPSTSKWESQVVNDKGASFVACPVFGSAVMADAGQLIANPAGKAQAVEKVLPFLTGVMSRDTIVLSGEEPEKGTLLKLIGNSFILNMVGALSEGHVLAEKSGLGTESLHKFIEKLFPGPYTAYSERMISGDYWQRKEPIGLVELALKDARHVQRLASDFHVNMKLVETVQGYLEQVVTLRGSNAEFISAYGAKRVEAGLRFENDSTGQPRQGT